MSCTFSILFYRFLQRSKLKQVTDNIPCDGRFEKVNILGIQSNVSSIISIRISSLSFLVDIFSVLPLKTILFFYKSSVSSSERLHILLQFNRIFKVHRVRIQFFKNRLVSFSISGHYLHEQIGERSEDKCVLCPHRQVLALLYFSSLLHGVVLLYGSLFLGVSI